MKNMTTLLQEQYSNNNKVATTTEQIMAWSNDKLRFPCVDNIGLKQLWKLLALDTNSTKETSNKKNRSKKFKMNSNNLTEQNNSKQNGKAPLDLTVIQLNKRQLVLPDEMSMLKRLAINALDLSAPATTVLLQHDELQKQQQQPMMAKPNTWMQLSGHPESIVPTLSGIVRKKVNGMCDNEVRAYELMSQELKTAEIVPKYLGTILCNDKENNTYIELQDLLAGFRDPCIMDIKLGTRTFLECEVKNKTQRQDLYQKMIAIDPQAPTAEEHEAQALTKLRYMIFREKMSSSHSKGFRIEALRLRGRAPIKELKKVRTSEQINQTITQFLSYSNGRPKLQRQLIKRLRLMRETVEQSNFFKTHEIVGSSIFIVYDEEHVGAWLIDFAKSRALPEGKQLTHRADWQPGNSEEGLLKGLDELIKSFECVQFASEDHGCACLQI